MELKEATYQMTDFGFIPSDWSELNLGSSSTLKARIGWQGLTTAEYLLSGDYILVTGTDFKDGYIDWNNCFSVEKDRYDQDPYIQLKTSDVLVTKDGTIGKVAIVEKLTKPATLNSGVFVIRPKQNQYLPEYLYYVLRSNHFDSFIKKLTAGSTITHLYQKDFVHYKIPLPPTLEEQKAIAIALSDVDTLITNLDKLIAKKKAIKQGAMQRLLKSPAQGGQRLPGFEGEWVEKALKDVAPLQRGFDLPTSKLKKGKYPVVYSNGPSNYHYRFMVKGPGIVTGRSGTIGNVFYIHEDFWPHNTALWVTGFYGNFPLYVYYLYSFIKLGQFGTGSGVPTLNRNDVHSYRIQVPSNYEEQQAIASILSDMDKEIESLETKKSKYLRIKQGMMQELLTGKTRLV